MKYLCLVAALLLAVTCVASATELNGRQATLKYARQADLQRFNRKVSQSAFPFGFGSASGNQLTDEVADKLNRYTRRVQQILDMYPKDFSCKVVLVKDRQAVDDIYEDQFRLRRGFIAFFSPKTETIYLSLEDLDRNVFAHELAHAVIHSYFDRAPPTKIHELLAQYVESQL